MKACQLEELKSVSELVKLAHEADDPVLVLDGEDECLISLQPSVFERFLAGTDALEYSGRSTMHL